MPPSTFPVERLVRFASELLRSTGVSDSDAQTCAARLLDADTRGQRAHGIARLPAYIRRIQEGGLNPTAVPHLQRESAVSALVDGDNGLGPVVMTFATELAIAKARQSGLAWIGVCKSNHAGANGVYAQMVVDADMVGIVAAVANTNQMAPWGGTERLLGPNPIAIGLPSGREQRFVLDMATTTVSFGTVRQRAASGQQLPVGWMIDRSGLPVTDPGAIDNATLVPIGGYKGYGLSLAIAALAGVLNTAASGSEVVDHYQDWTTPTNTGQLVIALDPELFRPLADFKEDLDARLNEIRSSEPMDNVQAVIIPGDRSAVSATKAARVGIEVSASLLVELQRLAERLGTSDSLEA